MILWLCFFPRFTDYNATQSIQTAKISSAKISTLKVFEKKTRRIVQDNKFWQTHEILKTTFQEQFYIITDKSVICLFNQTKYTVFLEMDQLNLFCSTNIFTILLIL